MIALCEQPSEPLREMASLVLGAAARIMSPEERSRLRRVIIQRLL